MTYYTKLIERLRDTPNWQRESYGDWKQGTVHYDRAPFEAAEAIEALQAENELLKRNLDSAKDVFRQDQECILRAVAERDALQAKLDELQRQEPVKFLVNATRFKTTMLANGRVLINDLPLELAGRWVAFVAAENDCHLKLAAPKTQEPLTDDQILDLATIDCGIDFGTDDIAEDEAIESVIALVRAAEKHHGITKGTP